MFWVKVHEANAALAEQEEVAPVQRRIEPRSADDSLSGVVRCLCFADTFLRDGEFAFCRVPTQFGRRILLCWFGGIN